MKWNKIFTGKVRQRNAILVVVFIIVMALVGPSMIKQSSIDDDIGIPSQVEITTSHIPSIPHETDLVTVTGVVTSQISITSENVDDSFVISNEDGAVLFWGKNGEELERTVTMVTSDGRTYTGDLPAQPVGTSVTYYVMGTLDSITGSSGETTYTVSEVFAEGGGDDGILDVQDRLPPIIYPPKVWLNNGTEVTWDQFSARTIWGTIYFEIEFGEGGNKIWSISLVADGTSYGSWWFGLKEGESYIWQLTWDTTNIPDGFYDIKLTINYWTSETRPESGGGGSSDIVIWEFAAFTIEGSEGNWAVVETTNISIIIGLLAIAVVSIIYYKVIYKRKRRR